MKRLFAVLVIAAFLTSGCGLFRSHHQWTKAEQENPLELPPSIDVPPDQPNMPIPPAS